VLIISDFKDYYDVGQKYGIDKSIRYIRKTTIKKYNKYLLHLKEFEKDRNYFEQNNLLKYFNYIKTTDIWFNRNINCSFCPNDLNYGFIIFCGNHHAFLNYNKKCFYSEEEFNNYLKINSKNFYSKYYLNRKQCKYNIDVKQYNIIKYFNNINNLPIDNKIHFKLECPIILFLINRQTNKKIIITNPILYSYSKERILWISHYGYIQKKAITTPPAPSC
jgi:hypothetical protein